MALTATPDCKVTLILMVFSLSIFISSRLPEPEGDGVHRQFGLPPACRPERFGGSDAPFAHGGAVTHASYAEVARFGGSVLNGETGSGSGACHAATLYGRYQDGE